MLDSNKNGLQEIQSQIDVLKRKYYQLLKGAKLLFLPFLGSDFFLPFPFIIHIVQHSLNGK